MEMIKRGAAGLFFLLPLLFLTVELAASGPSDSPGNPPSRLLWIDSRGQEVKLDKIPEKIISLGPNLTETIFALERGGALAGRTDYCDFPQEALSIPSVGGLQDPNLEKIIITAPDLVLASTHVSPRNLEALERAGIPTVLLYGPESFEGLYTVIEGCGALLGETEKAADLKEEIKKRVGEIERKGKALSPKPLVYYALGFGEEGEWTPGGDTFLGAMIRMAGGRNAAEDSQGWSWSREKLVETRPDIIILAKGRKAEFLKLPFYRDLEASKAGKVFEIDEDLLVRQGPRLAEGLEELHRLFHAWSKGH